MARITQGNDKNVQNMCVNTIFITLHAENVPTIDFQGVQILTRKFHGSMLICSKGVFLY